MKNTNLIIGKTNFGKTRGILFKEVEKAMTTGENLLILDSKEEYYKTYYKKLKENGYNVLIFNLADTTKSNGFNPLYLPYIYYKNGDLDFSVNLVNKFAHNLFHTDNSSSDPYWENMASDYFAGITQILFKEGNNDEINLGSVSVMINKTEMLTDENGKLMMKSYLNNFNPLDSIYILSSPTLFSPNETRESVVSVVKQKLNLILMRPNLLNLLNTSDIKLNEINDKTAIFVVGNDNYDYSYLINVFITQLIEFITKEKKQFTFILDNYDYPYIDKLKHFVENATYYNLKIYVAIKNRNEFEANSAPYIVDAFENVIILDKEMADLEMIGSDNEYPILEQKEHNYFDLENLFNK